jgi:hypothetical protein
MLSMEVRAVSTVWLEASGGAPSGRTACGRSRVIHPAALGGPLCRAELGGSIKSSAVPLGGHDRSQLARPERDCRELRR